MGRILPIKTFYLVSHDQVLKAMNTFEVFDSKDTRPIDTLDLHTCFSAAAISLHLFSEEKPL